MNAFESHPCSDVAGCKILLLNVFFVWKHWTFAGFVQQVPVAQAYAAPGQVPTQPMGYQVWREELGESL